MPVLQVAAPMVVGMLAFGGKWDSLLGLDPTGLYPIKVAGDHAVQAKKVNNGHVGQTLLAIVLGTECLDVLTFLSPGQFHRHRSYYC
jgi:hypothetical protein